MKKKLCVFFYVILGVGLGIVYAAGLAKKRIQRIKKNSDKHLSLYLLLYRWIKVKQEGKSIVSYFEKKGYKKVAIYGMSYMAELLIMELQGTDVQVVYGIDNRVTGKFCEIDAYLPNERLPEVDAVIVTAITFFDSIEKQLIPVLKCPIISIEDILYDVSDW